MRGRYHAVKYNTDCVSEGFECTTCQVTEDCGEEHNDPHPAAYTIIQNRHTGYTSDYFVIFLCLHRTIIAQRTPELLSIKACAWE